MDISDGIIIFIVLEDKLNKYGDRIWNCGSKKLNVLVSK